MTGSDYIQLSIAVVAGIAAILTAINIFFTNRQVNLQKEHWEFSHVPIFQISYISIAGNNSTIFVVENTNKVYHEISGVTFTMEDVHVEQVFDGTINKGEGKEIIAKGLIIDLKSLTDKYCEGYIQLRGKDALGNDYIVNSQEIKFNKGRIQNDMILSRTYLRKI